MYIYDIYWILILCDSKYIWSLPAICWKASLPSSSLRKQQQAHRNLFNHNAVNLRCILDWEGVAVAPGEPCTQHPAEVEPRGSKTIARPNIVNAKSTQLKRTIAVEKIKWLGQKSKKNKLLCSGKTISARDSRHIHYHILPFFQTKGC